MGLCPGISTYVRQTYYQSRRRLGIATRQRMGALADWFRKPSQPGMVDFGRRRFASAHRVGGLLHRDQCFTRPVLPGSDHPERSLAGLAFWVSAFSALYHRTRRW